jgi:hypothetical protein
MSLTDQVLNAFEHDQAEMKLSIKTDDLATIYKHEGANRTTNQCFDKFMALHTKHIDKDFRQ